MIPFHNILPWLPKHGKDSKSPIIHEQLCSDLIVKLTGDLCQKMTDIVITSEDEITKFEAQFICFSSLVRCISVLEHKLNVPSDLVAFMLEETRKLEKNRK